MFVRLRPNPYLCYVVAFGVALGVYLLGWSDLYPPIGVSMLLFLIATFAGFLFAAYKGKTSKQKSFQSPTGNDRWALRVTVLLYLGWLAEFVYEGGVPLIKIIFAIPYDYRLFGIPSFHVFMVTFTSYYTLYLFHTYLTSRSRLILILYIINLAAALLIYSRAMLILNLAGSLFIYLSFSKGITMRQLGWVAVSTILLFYLFGVLGSLRVSRIAGQPYNNENFMAIGNATETFRSSAIPKEFFWSYIYISSPLANLQQNINLDPSEEVTPRRITEMINSEILPDFVSKRTNAVFNLHTPVDSRIPGPFNVSTVYSRSYSYAGWTGMCIMAAFLAGFPIIFSLLVPPDSRFFLSGWCLLCTMYFFSMYDNTFRFTGLSFQLFFPIVLHWLDGKAKRLSRVF
jgi:hypothetical protein